ncbi:hypothetical protein G6011_11614 [Alternaria panax]|uniref:Heterokaryon incompatibility domain-containing protein n=1 Tax=Alternaria panax TaxID=48097 RepID=A0AAD4NTI2_9PLEO|nr:hypothetical protein G6011_11614 [Alternaria panax]
MEMPPKHVRFTHTPMNFKNREIRLLNIEPSSEPSSPIQITIKHVNFGRHVDAFARCREEVAILEIERDHNAEEVDAIYDKFGQERLNFVPLSYTWGPESPAHDILVTSPDSRGWLTVRQNLYDFLRIRRNCDPDWFWIDQICINQGQNDEKSHQVSQMAEIYSTSDVEVWLGPEFEGSNELVDLITRESVVSTQRPIPKLSVSEREMCAIIPTLRQFVHLPYWSRLWIIQEIVLGDFVTIRIGSKTLSWYIFSSGWKRLERAWTSLYITKEGEFSGQNFEGKVQSRIMSIRDLQGQQHQDWDDVGSLVLGAKCADVRDRAFGAMAMVHPSLRVFPDYSMLSQDLLLKIVTAHAQYISKEHPKPIATDVDVSQDPEYRDIMVREFVQECLSTTEMWFLHLNDDDKNMIDPKYIRRRLQEILPLFPPSFGCTIEGTWHFKSYLWYKVPNERSMRWRLARAGVEPLRRLSKRFKPAKKRLAVSAPDSMFADSDST